MSTQLSDNTQNAFIHQTKPPVQNSRNIIIGSKHGQKTMKSDQFDPIIGIKPVSLTRLNVRFPSRISIQIAFCVRVGITVLGFGLAIRMVWAELRAGLGVSRLRRRRR